MRTVSDAFAGLSVGLVFLAVAFWVDWGFFRVWSLAGLGLGYALWAGLAAPAVFNGITRALDAIRWGLGRIVAPWVRAAGAIRRRWRRVKPPPNS
jgi:hypothetical protein